MIVKNYWRDTRMHGTDLAAFDSEKRNVKIEDKFWDEEENELVRRYWISLGG